MKGTQRKTVACPSFKIILFIYSILNYFLCVWVFACLQVCVANVHLVPVRTRRGLWIPQTVVSCHTCEWGIKPRYSEEQPVFLTAKTPLRTLPFCLIRMCLSVLFVCVSVSSTNSTDGNQKRVSAPAAPWELELQPM